MGFTPLSKVSSPTIYLYTDSAFDWPASCAKHEPPAPIVAPDAEPVAMTHAEIVARSREGVQRLLDAWRADASSTAHFVLRPNMRPARFSVRTLGADELLVVQDQARSVTLDGENYVRRYEDNRRVFAARAACFEARDVFPGDEVHGYSANPDPEGGIGLIDDLWQRLPPDAQRLLGEAILRQIENKRAAQGK